MQLKEQLIQDTAQFPLIIYYQGNYEDIPTETLVYIIESNEKLANRKNQLRKVMFLSVEAIQNIQRYSTHLGHRSDLYLIFYDGESYQVVTQNPIRTASIQELKDRLDGLISKDLVELDELYLNVVDSEEKTEKGSGLGLIEITRKSNKNIHYEFKKIDEEYSLFNLYFAIPLVKKEESVFDFSTAKSLIHKLDQHSAESNSCFYYGGDFSNSFISQFLDLLLSKREEEKNNASKKVHHILIELIQNIKRHSSYEKENSFGRMLVEWKSKHIEITTYNNTHINNAREIQKKVVDLNGANKEQLIEISKAMLSDIETNNGLGLIDVANLIYPNKMKVNICKERNDVAELFFTININNE